MHFLVRGGGRWSRVILSVLTRLMGPDDVVFWISPRATMTETPPAGGPAIVCLPALDAVSVPIDAAIIATSSYRHAQDALTVISKFQPKAILIEKPMASCLFDAERLIAAAVAADTQIFVGHVVVLASYMADFADAIACAPPIVSIKIDWWDPYVENRYGARKTADWGTSIVRDQGSHAWSILDRLLPDQHWTIEDAGIFANPLIHTALSVAGRSDGEPIRARISLSRHAAARRRWVGIEHSDGTETSLDFASEPGALMRAGENIDLGPSWKAARSPLTNELSLLLLAARGEKHSDLERIDKRRGLDAVRFIDVAEAAVSTKSLEALASASGVSPATEAALIDIAIPALAAAGLRIDPTHEGRNFAASLFAALVARQI